MNDRQSQNPQLPKAATGIDGLDAITDGGLPAGRPTLLCGAAGCGKTLFGVTFLVEGAQRFDEPGVFMTFEERPEDIAANVGSLGYNLSGLMQKHVDSGLLRFEAARPTLYGFEMHLARMNRDLDEFKPTTTIIDPISAFRGSDSEVHSCLLRMVDILKTKGITAVMTRLTSEDENLAGGDQGIPSLIDTWVSLGALEANGERNRGL